MGLLKKLIFLTLLIGIIGFAYLRSGKYDIAASTPHWGFVREIISMTVDNSVKKHAKDIVAPALEDTAMVRTGFSHYQEMCAQCHAAPGEDRAEFADGLYPKAPKLQRSVEEWSPAELFWITKFGLKMTGMPAFGSTHTDQQIWAIVAFMKKLPALDSAGYAAYKGSTPEEEAGEE